MKLWVKAKLRNYEFSGKKVCVSKYFLMYEANSMCWCMLVVVNSAVKKVFREKKSRLLKIEFFCGNSIYKS